MSQNFKVQDLTASILIALFWSVIIESVFVLCTLHQTSTQHVTSGNKVYDL